MLETRGIRNRKSALPTITAMPIASTVWTSGRRRLGRENAGRNAIQSRQALSLPQDHIQLPMRLMITWTNWRRTAGHAAMQKQSFARTFYPNSERFWFLNLRPINLMIG